MSKFHVIQGIVAYPVLWRKKIQAGYGGYTWAYTEQPAGEGWEPLYTAPEEVELTDLSVPDTWEAPEAEEDDEIVTIRTLRTDKQQMLSFVVYPTHVLRILSRIGVPSVIDRLDRSAVPKESPWRRLEDEAPCEFGESARVMFSGLDWINPMFGLVSNSGSLEEWQLRTEGASPWPGQQYKWSLFDQVTGRYVAWRGPAPTYWRHAPAGPT